MSVFCVFTEKTPLYKIVAEHLEGWLETRAVAEQPVSAHIERELRSYLTCGILCFGFGRARCASFLADRPNAVAALDVLGRQSLVSHGLVKQSLNPQHWGVVQRSPCRNSHIVTVGSWSAGPGRRGIRRRTAPLGVRVPVPIPTLRADRLRPKL